MPGDENSSPHTETLTALISLNQMRGYPVTFQSRFRPSSTYRNVLDKRMPPS